MLCSVCNKNTAVIFVNKFENNKNSVEGLCYNCAKSKGINPLDVLAKQANLSEKDLEDMSKQFESIFTDLSENLDLSELDTTSEDGKEQNVLNSLFNMFGNDKSASSTPEPSSDDSSSDKRKVKTEKKVKEKKKKFLDMYGTNLTDKAKNNMLDEVIGRDREILRMTQILNRRSKNNPCLIGEPGVGKTAIAQGLALRIAKGNVPAKLLNKEIYLIDMTALIAGTQFRGQFEARMKSLIDECKQYGNIILVIDEIHNIIGAGDACC